MGEFLGPALWEVFEFPSPVAYGAVVGFEESGPIFADGVKFGGVAVEEVDGVVEGFGGGEGEWGVEFFAVLGERDA